MAVEAISPSPTTITHAIYANGTIVGKELAHVGAKVNGMAIEQVLVDVGDWVKQGQVLAILDNQNLHQDTLALEAERRQVEAQLNKVNADLARVEPLLAIDAISREQYDSYKTAQSQALANIDAINARLASLAINQKNSQIIAPISGVIAERQAQIGMMATGGTLFSIIKNGTLEWQASIKAEHAQQVALGQAVAINAGTDTIQAYVSRIAPTVNASRELTVYADLLDQHTLKSGMYQSGKILLNEQNALRLPQKAIMNHDGRDFVWQLHKTTKDSLYRVSKTNLTLGEYQDDGVVVDLPSDVLVVAQGGSFLSDGNLVKVIAPTKSDSQAPSSDTAK